MENHRMNSIDPTSTQNTTPTPTNEVLEVPENIGIDFDRLQEMVDEIERELVNEDKTENPVKKSSSWP